MFPLILTLVYYVIVVGLLFKAFVKITTGWCTSPVCLVGKTALVTGGNSGIGYETVLNLASRGCRVIIADIADSEESKRKIINATGNDNIVCKHLDLGSLKSVREFAADLVSSEERLDILVNNAGAAGFNDIFTEDGMVKAMQINHFGSFLLTHLLVDLLKKTPKSRVVFVSSLLAYGHKINSVEDINKPAVGDLENRKTITDYSNSKLCNIITSNGFARRLRKHGITVNAVHPGVVRTSIFATARSRIDSPLKISILHFINDTMMLFYGKNPVEGAQNTLHCALSRDLAEISGELFVDCYRFWQPKLARDSEFAEAVWRESEKLVKLTDEEKAKLD